MIALALPGFAQNAAPTPPKLRGRTIVTHSGAKTGWLGVGLVQVTPERAKALNLKEQSGVEITHVESDSPASKAGIKEKDVILDVNGQKVEGPEQFIGTISEAGPGAKVNLGIWRGGAKQTIAATLESRPAQFFTFNGPNGPFIGRMPEMPNIEIPEGPFSVLTGQAPRVGFEGETLTPQLAEYFGVKEGVLVRTVTAKTPAEKAGLKAGDVITKVAGTPVSSPREISGLVRAARRAATFTVVRNHKEVLLNVEIAEDRIPSPDREVL
jgi:serine protease Do